MKYWSVKLCDGKYIWVKAKNQTQAKILVKAFLIQSEDPHKIISIKEKHIING